MTVDTEHIQAHVDVPPIIHVPKGRRTVELTVRLGLENVSKHDYVLHAPDAGQELFWHVLDPNHKEILREQPERTHVKKRGVEEFRSKVVAAGHTVHESEVLSLDAARLRDGATYTVRAEIFGQVAETSFVALTGPGGKAARKTARKKAARKKPARKKARKKTARKKPARKKTARKKARKKTTRKKAARKKTRRR